MNRQRSPGKREGIRIAVMRAAIAKAVPAALAIVLLGTVSVRGGVIASDTFTTNAPDGTPLNGRVTEVGNLTWNAGPSMQITGGAVQMNGALATVPFLGPGYSNFTVEGDLDPNTPTINWLALGFARSTNGQLDGGAGVGVLWGLLRGAPYSGDGDNWQLFINGTTRLLGSGFAATNSGFNHVAVSYNTNTTVVTFAINGVDVFSNAVAGVNVNAISYAGLGEGSDPNGLADNFLLTGVPEPSAAALALLGGVALIRAWERKSERA